MNRSSTKLSGISDCQHPWRAWSDGKEENGTTRKTRRAQPVLVAILSASSRRRGRELSRSPAPLSNDFWKMYGEPLQDFVHLAEQFGEAVRSVSGCDFTTSEEQQGHLRCGKPCNFFVFLRGCSVPVRKLTPKQAVFTSSNARLPCFCSYAGTVLRDLAMGRRIRECQTCDRFFVSTDVKAQYCWPAAAIPCSEEDSERLECQSPEEILVCKPEARFG